MRYPALTYLACAAALALASPCAAQQPQQLPPLRVKIEKVRIGFQGSAQADPAGTFKPGLWVPVHVTLVAAPDGQVTLPVRLDRTAEGELHIETVDSDEVPNVFPQRFRIATEKGPRFNVIGYTKPAAMNPNVRVTLRAAGTEATASADGFAALALNESLYLTLGGRLDAVYQALLQLTGNPKAEQTNPRHLAHEDDVARLPTRWYGYSPVDLVVLTGNNKGFLEALGKDKTRLEALASWVRHGGRLVVSTDWKNQDLLRQLLTDRDAWQPALPDVLPADQQVEFKRLFSLQNWSGVAEKKPFLRLGESVRTALLRIPDGVEVEAREPGVVKRRGPDGKEVQQQVEAPLIVRTPHGLGSVTVLAFDVASDHFKPDNKGQFRWKGAPDFWAAALRKLAPRVVTQRDQPGPGGFNPRGAWVGDDLTTHLQQELDKFDTPPISFGWVALFILLYILVVGPFDYLLLKKVFKRLELTWITFPAVVLTISLAAYFTAYAVKGRDLKVNKVDLVDLDLRTDLNKDLAPRSAHAYGTTWFTILSPRIQSYTIGIEPVFPRAAGGPKAAKDAAPPALVTWLGRPETAGMGASGRQRSQSLFMRTYTYEPEAAGLRDVPIPVWTTKSFTACWDAPLKALPFEAKLEFDPDHPDRQLFGKIKSNLPFELQNCAILYGARWYPLNEDCLPGRAVDVAQQKLRGMSFNDWVSGRIVVGEKVRQFGDPDDMLPGGPYEPGLVVKELMFHEKADPQQRRARNHAQRLLDQSWRLTEERPDRDGVVREAILVGRVPREAGRADGRAPTNLWLGAIPGGDQERPALNATMRQDTYVRVFLPVTRVKR
ncbi:MAG: hypothetical protein IT429_01620 [Gemmataceae bacterium]|nr:hypothetical protein [Gemmataceae bacterium]